MTDAETEEILEQVTPLAELLAKFAKELVPEVDEGHAIILFVEHMMAFGAEPESAVDFAEIALSTTLQPASDAIN